MYNGIGLTTARGSGTNGYVQSNKFFIRPKTTTNVAASGKGGFEPGQGTAGLSRKPNKEILEHDRKRQMELKLVVLEDKLVDQGYTTDEIAEKISEARKKLEEEAVAMTSIGVAESGGFSLLSASNNKVSDTQTHQVAARKEKQMEKLRAALGIVPDAGTQVKKDGNTSNMEETDGNHEISDSSDKDRNDDDKFHDKDPKNRNVVATKVVKKNQTGRGSVESRSLKKQQSKELGELSDSSDTETDEKHLKRFPTLQRYHQESASESDSDEERKNPSKVNRKGKSHGSDNSESGDDKYIKITRNAHDKRTRKHDIEESESDYESHEKRTRKNGKDVFRSEGEKYEKHVRSYEMKRTSNDDSEDEKYRERHDMRRRRHGSGDFGSGDEEYEKASKRGDRESKRRDPDMKYGKHREAERRHGSGDFGSGDEEYEKASKRGDRENKRRDPDMKYGKNREAEKVSTIDRWNNKYDKDYRKYEAGFNFDDEEPRNLTKGNGNVTRSRRHDTDDENDNKNVKKIQKIGKHDKGVHDSSESKSSDADGTDGSDSDLEDYKRKKADKEKSCSRAGVDRNARARNVSSVIEVKGSIRFRGLEDSKEKSVPKKVDGKEDTLRKLELYGSKSDMSGNGSREMMKGKRKLEDGFLDEQLDEQPEIKFRRNDVGFEEKSRSFRSKDADLKREDYSREKKFGGGPEEEHGRKTYAGKEPQVEISRKDNRDHKKEERDNRESQRSDLERGGKRYSRNDDENMGMARHRKDEDDSIRKNERDDVEREHGGSRRRGREEEWGSSGRDEKRLMDSSKRAKYADYRSEEKRRYDDAKRDDRDAARSRRHN